jgi:hypothetical protein
MRLLRWAETVAQRDLDRFGLGVWEVTVAGDGADMSVGF